VSALGRECLRQLHARSNAMREDLSRFRPT
jgi:hypothetical protein